MGEDIRAMAITTEQQNFIDSLIGKRIIVISKKHPRFGETGRIKKFYPVVGITEKPGFEIAADEGDNLNQWHVFACYKLLAL